MTALDNAVKERVFKYALTQYGTQPEYLWKNLPDACVLRHTENNRWYAVVMSVLRERLGIDGDGEVCIIDVKCSPEIVGSVIKKRGFLPAYHMNKVHWITILLDGTADDEEIFKFIDLSYLLTK